MIGMIPMPNAFEVSHLEHRVRVCTVLSAADHRIVDGRVNVDARANIRPTGALKADADGTRRRAEGSRRARALREVVANKEEITTLRDR